MRVLIAYDGSDCSRQAVSDLQLAGLPRDAEVLVFSAVDAWAPADSGPNALADDALPRLKDIRASVMVSVERARAIAEDAAAQLRVQYSGWKVTSDACADSPAWAIIKRAEGFEGGIGGRRADLVVIGSHGYGGIRRLVLGSVSHKVLTEVDCSVRITHARATAATRHAHAPKIVVGVDGSFNSLGAVDAVASRQWPTGTRVLVASFEQHMLPDSGGVGAYSVWGGNPLEFETVSSESAGSRVVAQAAERLTKRCPELAVTTAVQSGDPKYGLVELAENWGKGGGSGADCIFVGAKGVRGVERFLLGSVSTAVAMNAKCTVEVVHAPD